MVAATKESKIAPSAFSRREMLNYALGASAALVLAGSCGGIVWFAQEMNAAVSARGLIRLDLNDLPIPRYTAVYLNDLKCILSNPDGQGLLALYAVAPDDGCMLQWVGARFQSGCRSAFQLDGTILNGPATRNMDRYELIVTTDHGTFTTPDDGSPVPIEGATSIVVNTNRLIRGKPRS